MTLWSAISEVLITRKAPFQLVRHMHEVPAAKLTWPAFAEVKYDGVFCAVIAHRGEVRFVSRTGLELYLEEDVLCNEVFHELPDGVYVTELVNHRLSLEELSGLVNPNRVNAWSTGAQQAMQSCDFVCHDYIPLDHFGAGFSPNSFAQRRAAVAMKWPGRISAGTEVRDLAAFEEFAEGHIENGEEGVVLKQYNTPWTAGHKGWHVTKKVCGGRFDLRCVDYKIGTKGTKREGLVAKLVFEFRGNTFSADLGAGWTDKRRAELTTWLLARVGLDYGIFTVTALSVSSTGKALRLPKVGAQRFDKETPDE